MSYAGNAFALAAGDLNLDGNIDLAFTNGFMLGKGDGTFQPPQPLVDGTTSVAIASFTADGLPDVLVLDSTGNVVVYPNSCF